MDGREADRWPGGRSLNYPSCCNNRVLDNNENIVQRTHIHAHNELHTFPHPHGHVQIMHVFACKYTCLCTHAEHADACSQARTQACMRTHTHILCVPMLAQTLGWTHAHTCLQSRSTHDKCVRLNTCGFADSVHGRKSHPVVRYSCPHSQGEQHATCQNS